MLASQWSSCRAAVCAAGGLVANRTTRAVASQFSHRAGYQCSRRPIRTVHIGSHNLLEESEVRRTRIPEADQSGL